MSVHVHPADQQEAECFFSSFSSAIRSSAAASGYFPVKTNLRTDAPGRSQNINLFKY